MDNLTHTLTGIALSQAGLNRKTRFASLALIVGANLPDVDSVSALRGSVTYLKYHRGITHSLVGVTVLAVLLAGVIYSLGRRARPKDSVPVNGRWLLAICWVATATHLLMDFTNPYGVRPFLPFSGRWCAWDIMPIIDPLLLTWLVAGLGLSFIFRLVSEEVGARRPGLQRGALLALGGMVLLWGIRDLSHRRALGLLDSHTYGEESPLRLGAFPGLSPFQWTGVVETDTAFHVLTASSLDPDVGAENTQVFHKAEASAVLEAALRTRTGMVFSDFARFLWARVEQDQDGFEVTLRDLRFVSPLSPRTAFVATIELDRGLHVRSQSFSFLGRSGT